MRRTRRVNRRSHHLVTFLVLLLFAVNECSRRPYDLLPPCVATSTTSENDNDTTRVKDPPVSSNEALSCTLSQGEEGECRKDDDSMISANEIIFSNQCGLWVAPSTIPNAGIGLFAGRNFDIGQALLPYNGGDISIPIVDIGLNHKDYNGDETSFERYTWEGSHLGLQHLGHDEVQILSPGIAAIPNCVMDLVNIQEGSSQEEEEEEDGLPVDVIKEGIGAVTEHRGRIATATRQVTVGQELFVNYGNNWFEWQLETLGPIPLLGDHVRAENLYETFMYGILHTKSWNFARDFWETFIENNTWESTSRILAAYKNKLSTTTNPNTLPFPTWNQRIGYHRRSQDWLKDHGVCADHMYANTSQISPQAGHGAFATRHLPKGSLVATVPLLHIMDKMLLDMYEEYVMPPGDDDEKTRRGGSTTTTRKRFRIRGARTNQNKKRKNGLYRPNQKPATSQQPPVRKQLLLNYCFGHNESTLLLCPFGGPMVSLINHPYSSFAQEQGRQQSPNVKLQWASPHRSNHQEQFLRYPLSELAEQTGSVLAMELVALRDIAPHEEILLDYGPDWQLAWEQHVETFGNAATDRTDYTPARVWNRQITNGIRLRTRHELQDQPYPDNIQLMFDIAFTDPSDWKPLMMQSASSSSSLEELKSGFLVPVEIVKFQQRGNGRILYSAVIPPNGRDRVMPQLIKQAPIEAFQFVDRAYSTNMFLPYSFRKEIGIPNDLFPDIWKNLAD